MSETEKRIRDKRDKLFAQYDNIRRQVSRDLQLDNTNFMSQILIFSSRHHFYVTLMIDEKIKIDDLNRELIIRKKVVKSELQMARGNRIQLTKKDEEELLVSSDDRILELSEEISMRKKIAEYLKMVSEIFASQKFVFTNIKDIMKIESI